MVRPITQDYSIHLPLQPIEEAVSSCVHKVSNFVKQILAPIANPFFYVYQTIAGTSRKIEPLPTKATYRVTEHPIQSDLDDNPHIIATWDGGGTRGVVALKIAMIIEELTRARFHQFTDKFGGVSTGSLIATLLADGKSAEEIMTLYTQLAKEVFANSLWRRLWSFWGAIGPKYETPTAIFKNIIGDRPLSSTKAKSLFITSYDLRTGSTVCFQNKEEPPKLPHEKKIEFLPGSISILDAVTASTAAPTYFRSLILKIADKIFNLIDGGIAENNPAMLATELALHEVPKGQKIFVLSVGTGRSKTQPVITEESVDWGWLQWVPNLIDVIMGSKEIDTDNQMIQLSEHSDGLVTYLRIQINLDKEDANQLDNADPAYLQRLCDKASTGFTDWIYNKGGMKKLIEVIIRKVAYQKKMQAQG